VHPRHGFAKHFLKGIALPESFPAAGHGGIFYFDNAIFFRLLVL
jgi:hypothetical protein